MSPIRHGLNGLLASAAALALAVPSLLGHAPGFVGSASLGLAVATLWLAAIAGPARPELARAVATGALLATMLALAPSLSTSASAALAAVIVLVGLLSLLWPVGEPGSTRRARRANPGLDARTADLRAAFLGAAAIALFALRAPETDAARLDAALWLGCAATARFAAGWCGEARRHDRWRALGVTGAIVGAIAVCVWLAPGRVQPASMLAALTPAVVLARRPRRGDEPSPGWAWLLLHPARSLVITFSGLTAVGTAGLLLPGMLEPGHSLAVLDAAFTATSAVCVTGLVVVDTATTFSPLGEGWILLLIQTGALGIMTFSTAAITALGRRLSLRHEGVLAEMVSGEDRGALQRSLKTLLGYAFACEATGALVLTGLFHADGLAWRASAWRGLFTAVSAFGNAGFALESDSLVAHQGSALLLHAVALLIVAGGVSPLVALALPRLLRREPVPLSVRVVWSTTVLLLALGFVLIVGIEWHGALAPLSPMDRLHNAWFQSVTLRTAGFNSIDLTTLSTATLMVMMALMFVGGSPGGTAGGIKTTTAAVLVLAVVAAIRGRDSAMVFGRRLPHATVYRAAAIATVGLATGFTILLALELTQALPARAALFEAVSALGTVGLSIGATPKLDAVGKLVIMTAMLIGRVGPLTLFLFLRDRSSRPSWRLPEESVDVG